MLPEGDGRSGDSIDSAEGRSVLEEDERALAAGLAARDEAAFFLLVDRYHRSMIRIALRYARTYAVAEEIVQETWLAVISRVQYFEHRSSLKTWIYRILFNIARRRSRRESRSIPLSAYLGDPAETSGDPEESLTRAMLRSKQGKSWPRAGLDHFRSPEGRLLAEEVRETVERLLPCLPSRQRMVVSLRDLEGWTSKEVCFALKISPSNQRVLLHRGRTKLRKLLGYVLGSGARK